MLLGVNVALSSIFFDAGILFTVICYKNSIFCLNVEHISLMFFLPVTNNFEKFGFIKPFLMNFTALCIIFALN